MADLAVTLAPVVADRGIATGQELDVETLYDRMHAEVVANHSLVRSHLQVGAWAQA
jgi:hypothetical protein